jgi:cell division protein FtsB
MARRRRRTVSLFNLSFLDIMSCGFGAVVLVFLITKHSMSVHSEDVNANLIAEVNRIEEDVEDGRLDLVRLKEQLAQAEREIADAETRVTERAETTEDRRIELARLKQSSSAREAHINELRSDIEALEEQTRSMEGRRFGDDTQGTAARSVVGEGNRQYLTGMRVGGDRILVLFDISASMLDDTIVNILRRRNMDAERQRSAPKWQQALGTLDWISAQLPLGSRFQIHTFSESWQPALEDSRGTWLDVTGPDLDDAADRVRERLPGGGTNLKSVFEAVNELQPLPDNIYLITDGLPTRDASQPRQGTADGSRRLKLFTEAARALPPGIPVNVILLHLEGDPMAASSFWKLAADTGGSFISPSKDWP